MGALIWAPQSLADLESIRDYIAKDSPRYAILFVEDIIRVVAAIETNPLAGRVVSEFQIKALRERIHGSYRIVYRVRREHVEIVTIQHCARVLKRRRCSLFAVAGRKGARSLCLAFRSRL